MEVYRCLELGRVEVGDQHRASGFSSWWGHLLLTEPLSGCLVKGPVPAAPVPPWELGLPSLPPCRVEEDWCPHASSKPFPENPPRFLSLDRERAAGSHQTVTEPSSNTRNWSALLALIPFCHVDITRVSGCHPVQTHCEASGLRGARVFELCILLLESLFLPEAALG